MSIRRSNLRAAYLAAIAIAICVPAGRAQTPRDPGHWVTAWSTAVHAPRTFPGMPPPFTLKDQTIREIIRPTIAGSQLRLRLTNELGSVPLQLSSVHIGLVDQDGNIEAGSDRALTFDGKNTVAIPAGAPMLSDPVSLNVPAFANVAISIYVSKETTPTTFHLLGQRATLISGPGDFTSAKSIQDIKQVPSWYWLSDLEMRAPETTAAVVTFGDSITDGFGAKAGEYQDWPDLLADRLAQTADAPSLAIDNEGIGGNRILFTGAGVSALARMDRDVLVKPGVTALILLEGINDIGWPNMKPRKLPDGSMRINPFAGEAVTAADLIMSMKQIIERAHSKGIFVFGATMTPYEDADYFTPDGESVRETVNQWIRTGDAFDGVFDFDAAVRDPNHPEQFREDYQHGDHLHPNAAGYKAMAACIDIGTLCRVLTANQKPSRPKSKAR